MNIGQKLFELRKSAKLSQEEVADKLNVTRQTVSKWETNQSTPDFDKIAPLCELYKISADELLTGKETQKENLVENKSKKALGIGIGVLLYFISIIWIMIAIPVLKMNPIIASSIFLLICAVATIIIIYMNMTYKKKKNENPFLKQIKMILFLITLIIYLLLSFVTMAWHITWILWIVASLIQEIIKLIFILRGEANEK